MNQDIIDFAEHLPYVKEVKDYGATIEVRMQDYCNVIDIDAIRAIWSVESDISVSYNRGTNSIIIAEGSVSR